LPKIEIEDHREANKNAIMKISMHETIGDDDIQIIPHEDIVEIRESSPEPIKEEKFIKNDDFYDIDDELPALEPFTFEGDEKVDDEEYLQKQEMKSKMSKLLKDTNMVFAMCSSLKELGEGESSLSSSSHIQRSTSSSLTTNTTTATFASASSNADREGHDSDYKSLDLDLEESSENITEFKVPQPPPIDESEKEDPEDISSFEATSSETDADSDSKKNFADKFKREDDEELRPLLETSITSLSSPVDATTTITTTEANATSTLPELNQKSQTTTTNTSNNGKRKNKKKRR
jgi:hypothetical protein